MVSISQARLRKFVKIFFSFGIMHSLLYLLFLTIIHTGQSYIHSSFTIRRGLSSCKFNINAFGTVHIYVHLGIYIFTYFWPAHDGFFELTVLLSNLSRHFLTKYKDMSTSNQCSGSMTFWCGSGSGSADPCLWLMDPDPGSGSCYFRHWPSRCQQKTNFLTQFFCLFLFECTFTLFFKDKKSKRVTKY